MGDGINETFVGFEEAQKLIPVFKWYRKNGQWKELRKDADEVLQELERVRNVDYAPLSGHQIILKSRPYELLQDVRAGLVEQS